MKSYKQIRSDIERLEREAQAARKAEIAAVVERVRKLIEPYGLTAADLGLEDAQPPSRQVAAKKTASRKAPARKAVRRNQGEAKYRDPKSGRTWSGRGRIPQWIAAAKDREAFRVDAGDAQEKAEAAEPSTAPTKKAGKTKAKPAAKAKAGAKTAASKTAPRKAAARKAAPAKGAAAKKRPAAGKRAAAPATEDASAAAPPVPEPRIDSPPATAAPEADEAAAA